MTGEMGGWGRPSAHALDSLGERLAASLENAFRMHFHGGGGVSSFFIPSYSACLLKNGCPLHSLLVLGLGTSVGGRSPRCLSTHFQHRRKPTPRRTQTLTAPNQTVWLPLGFPKIPGDEERLCF